ncbi:alkaline phosphatase D family protein [Rhizobium terrae]|uniref:alkaline phosphatase D family protein n=1 Tax=Rhizobium terrae TaxID=2171756 RepID=UPI0013C2D2CF|nr:alkaline phosphatase D family protein [Rhizobium terrae]
MKRRHFLAGAGLALAAPALTIRSVSAQAVAAGAGFPFSVASGDPTSDAVVLWTRLARAVDDLTPVAAGPVEVEWIVASDEKMSDVVRRGIGIARPEFGHSVHVDVEGLQPDRSYWYAFRLGGEISPVGRTRTLPSALAPHSRFRFNVVSCQHWENGYFDAYDGMADDDASLVLHMGDYIYEVGRGGVRSHESKTAPATLADYRRRHALYKTDTALRRAHERMPFMVTLDNHDALTEDTSDMAKLKLRAAAYQAWYEFQPVRHAPALSNPAMQILRDRDIGNLLRLSIPDTRQFKDRESSCASDSDKNFAFGVFQKACDAASAADRSMLGAPQEAWLDERLKTSKARWNVIASTVMMTPFDMDHGGELYRYLQSWDGYPAERARILDRIEKYKVGNPIAIAGDIHSNLVSDVVRRAGDDPKTALMSEFVGTSISSLWPDQLAKPMQAALPANPHIRHYEHTRRGYLRMTVTEDRWTTDLRTIEFTDKPGGKVSTEKSFVVENGQAGVKAA